MAKNAIGKSKNLKKASNGAKWSTKKKIIVGSIIGAVVVALVVLAIVLGVVLSRQTSTTSTTTDSSLGTIIYWSLDGVTTDSTNTYNGTLVNSATYFSTSYNQPYVAYGRGLSLSSSSYQYMRVSSPFLDLTYKSFTVEAWIYSSTSFTGDNGILGECQCSTCSNQCFYFLIRGSRLYAGFLLNDISGSQNISSGYWHHVAFVYNYNMMQQSLFVDGVLDSTKSGASAYQGTNGTIDIGSTVSLSVRNYFNGYIDNVKVTLRAKSASELLTAATLVAFFSFDVPNSFNDNGPLGLNGTGSNAIIVAGRVNQALRLTSSSSYFYAYGFFQIGYGVNPARPFTVSLWINPSTLSACTIVQFAATATSGNCINAIGIYSATGLTGQIIIQGWAWPYIVGPYLYVGTWTHVSMTYSFNNGMQLYVNGAYFGTTGSFSYSNSGYIMFLRLGYPNSCSSSSISNSAYQGSVDEVYVHNRELSASEIAALANP